MLDKAYLLRDPGHFLALGAGSGLLPKGPGTAGTLIGVALYWSLAGLDKSVYLSVVAVLFVLGIALCHRTAQALDRHDHPAIVWDEIVGYLLTMAFTVPSIRGCLIAFIAFRIFDIFKPWPIRVLDQRVGGGLGIMLDDALAAIYAGLVVVFIEYLSYS
ncbi:MAG: phosphatidylglycerophosphatase A [Proteobacteria bacterium]|nr:MAG: phosphatidylglycerophosphatase A [Pseudomonadota bacterium]